MGDDGGDRRWLSYDELGQARGISRASAVRLAQRRKWPRRQSNDGTARVSVPVAELSSPVAPDIAPADIPDVVPDAAPVVAPDVGAALVALTEALTAAQSDVAGLRERVGRAEGEGAGLRVALAEAQARAEAAAAEVRRLRGLGWVARLLGRWGDKGNG